MSESNKRVRATWPGLMLLAVLVTTWAAIPARPHGGPIDAPASNEPRVPVAKCLGWPGLVESEGSFKRWTRVSKGDVVYSRDLLVCLPGFKVDVETDSRAVKLTLWGNLPGLSESPVLESSAVLHDSKAYDLDMTLIGGRIVLTNTKDKGPAKVWLRVEGGVQLTLAKPGDAIAIELYGRWPAGVPFVAKPKASGKPIRLWEVHCLKGHCDIQASKTHWFMDAPPGASYFQGDSVDGPASSGPEKRATLPEWWDPKAKRPLLAKLVEATLATYKDKLTSNDPEEVAAEMLVRAEKEGEKSTARVIRYMVVHALCALGDVKQVVEALDHSRHNEMRNAAVVALRHWIGVNEGRDNKLYEVLLNDLHFTKAEAETVMQLLHSPFDPQQAETYETLIAYLKHRKQAVRELAHWHLIRLAPIGRGITYDASAAAETRDKAAAAWKELVPSGTLPKEKPDETKKGK